MYLSSGCVMDGVAFSLWQVEGALRLRSLVGRICKLGGAGREVGRGEGSLGRAGAIIQHERGSFRHLHSHSHHVLWRPDLVSCLTTEAKHSKGRSRFFFSKLFLFK